MNETWRLRQVDEENGRLKEDRIGAKAVVDLDKILHEKKDFAELDVTNFGSHYTGSSRRIGSRIPKNIRESERTPNTQVIEKQRRAATSFGS